jgi:FkbM family methyltransferase
MLATQFERPASRSLVVTRGPVWPALPFSQLMFKRLAKFLLSALLPKALYYRFARAYGGFVAARFNARIIERTYAGHTLKIQIRDEMGLDWYDCDWELPPEMRVFQDSSLRSGARIYEIGAHQGVVALILSKLVGSGGHVIAVEADPWNANIACENKALNDANHLEILLSAVTSAVSGGVEASTAEVDRMYDWSLCGVPRITLDGMMRRYGKPDLVYMDIDGYELQALQGSADVLATDADWFVEVHVNAGLENENGSWQEVLSFFPADRYVVQISRPDRGAFVPFDVNSPILQDRFFMVAKHRRSGR